jgi:hypothetical protein
MSKNTNREVAVAAHTPSVGDPGDSRTVRIFVVTLEERTVVTRQARS